MRNLTLAVALVGLTALPALAQTQPDTTARPGRTPGVGVSLPQSDKASNIGPSNTTAAPAPSLPTPMVSDNAGAYELLRTARAALVANRTGLAQESLEMAETRSLDRAVMPGQAITASDSRFVGQIRDARRALGNGNRAQAIELIDLALAG